MDKLTQLPPEETPIPLATEPLPHKEPGQRPPRRGSRLLLVAVVSVLLCATVVAVTATVGANILNSGTGAALVTPQATTKPTAPVSPHQVVGHITFLSSGQIKEMTSEGITDQVQIDLANIPAPADGKSYYAWLLGDTVVESRSILLGILTVNNGVVHFVYQGDQNHTNLLEISNRFLVTQEDAAIIPTVPSLDTASWVYSAQFSITPIPQDTVHHFSLLDHLRHLMAADPKLNALTLPGGIETWLYRNTQKVLEYASSARDDWAQKATPLMHRQFIRILDYLDGRNYVLADVPADTPIMVDPRLAQVGLLEFDVANQDPPGYVYHMGIHLQGITLAPGATPEQHALANRIIEALNKVQVALERVHQDAKQLVAMTDAQILTPASLAILNDMLAQAQIAFAGQIDQNTGELQDGVTQIHYATQRMTTLDVIVAQPNTGN